MLEVAGGSESIKALGALFVEDLMGQPVLFGYAELYVSKPDALTFFRAKLPIQSVGLTFGKCLAWPGLKLIDIPSEQFQVGHLGRGHHRSLLQTCARLCCARGLLAAPPGSSAPRVLIPGQRRSCSGFSR